MEDYIEIIVIARFARTTTYMKDWREYSLMVWKGLADQIFVTVRAMPIQSSQFYGQDYNLETFKYLWEVKDPFALPLALLQLKKLT